QVVIRLPFPELCLRHAARRVAGTAQTLVRRDVPLRIAVANARVVGAPKPAGIGARQVSRGFVQPKDACAAVHGLERSLDQRSDLLRLHARVQIAELRVIERGPEEALHFFLAFAAARAEAAALFRSWMISSRVFPSLMPKSLSTPSREYGLTAKIRWNAK